MAGKINGMFSKIYQEYDFMNHLFSFNFDKLWRGSAARDAMIPKRRFSVLDVDAGTGDLSIAVERAARAEGRKADIIAYDFNKDMLAVAREKFDVHGAGDIRTEIGSAFRIKHPRGSFDVITSGFALRSFVNSRNGRADLQRFLSESYRVLKPGGRIVLLDMAMPDDVPQRAFFSAYSMVMLFLGSFVDKDTYAWLVRTIKAFDKRELLGMMKSTGFKKVGIRSLISGIAFIAYAER